MSGSDSWAGASVITGANGSTTVDNTTFTSEASEPIPSNGPGTGPWQSSWWKWTAPTADAVYFSTEGSRQAGGTVGIDTVLAVYTGTSLAALTEVGSNDDYPSFSGLDSFCSRVDFTPTSGTTYYIQASGYDNTEFGDLHLTWVTPVSATPVITAPTGGTVYTPGTDSTVTLTWTEASQTHYEVVTSGVTSSDSGIVAGSTSTVNIPVTYTDLYPWQAGQGLTIQVRAKQTGKAWSPYASVSVTIDPVPPIANVTDDDRDSSTGSISLNSTIPTGGCAFAAIATSTTVSSVPSGWTLHDSGTVGSIHWYRYLRTTAGSGPWTWSVASGGDVAGVLSTAYYIDSAVNPVGSVAPLGNAQLIWGATTTATGDNCTAASVVMPRSGTAIASWLGYAGVDGWYVDPATSYWPHGLSSSAPPNLNAAHQGLVVGSASTTPVGVANPRASDTASVDTGFGGDNVGFQVGIPDFEVPAVGMGFVLGMLTF